MTDLHIEALTQVLGSRPVLQNLDLTVESGRLVAILGASGSGKTTLLRCICGFERPDKGSIRIGGTIVADRTVNVPPQRRHVGYVAQEGALFPGTSGVMAHGSRDGEWLFVVGPRYAAFIEKR